MQISKSSLTYRLFRFYMRQFTKNPHEEPRDLCRLVRFAYLWNGVQFLVIAAGYAAGVAAIVAVPLRFGEGALRLVIVVGVIAAFVVISAGVSYLCKAAVRKSAPTVTEKAESMVEAAKSSAPWQYLIAVKKRICPMLEIHP